MNQNFNDFYKDNGQKENSSNHQNDPVNIGKTNDNGSLKKYNNNAEKREKMLDSLNDVVENKVAKLGTKYYKILNIVMIFLVILLMIPTIIISKNMISKNDYSIISIILIIIFIVLQILLLIAIIKVRKAKDGIVKGYKVFNNVSSIFKSKKQENTSLYSDYNGISNNSFEDVSNKKNENKLTKKEILYNKILKIITIFTIIIWTIHLFLIIEFIFDIAIGVIKDPASILSNGSGRLDLFGMLIFGYMIGYMVSSVVSYWIPTLIFILLLFIIIYIFLIVKAFKIRKTKERKIKWKDLFYLIFLYFDVSLIIAILQLFNTDSLFLKIATYAVKLGVVINIILLIIILLKRKDKKE